jgi:hypothetical protein
MVVKEFTVMAYLLKNPTYKEYGIVCTYAIVDINSYTDCTCSIFWRRHFMARSWLTKEMTYILSSEKHNQISSRRIYHANPNKAVLSVEETEPFERIYGKGHSNVATNLTKWGSDFQCYPVEIDCDEYVESKEYFAGEANFGFDGNSSDDDNNTGPNCINVTDVDSFA